MRNLIISNQELNLCDANSGYCLLTMRSSWYTWMRLATGRLGSFIAVNHCVCDHLEFA